MTLYDVMSDEWFPDDKQRLRRKEIFWEELMAKGGSKRGAVWEHFTEEEGKTASGKAKKLGRCKHCKETA